MKKITFISILSVVLMASATMVLAKTVPHNQTSIHAHGRILTGTGIVSSLASTTMTISTHTGTTTQVYTLTIPTKLSHSILAPAPRNRKQGPKTVKQPNLAVGNTVKFSATSKQGHFTLTSIHKLKN